MSSYLGIGLRVVRYMQKHAKQPPASLSIPTSLLEDPQICQYDAAGRQSPASQHVCEWRKSSGSSAHRAPCPAPPPLPGRACAHGSDTAGTGAAHTAATPPTPAPGSPPGVGGWGGRAGRLGTSAAPPAADTQNQHHTRSARCVGSPRHGPTVQKTARKTRDAPKPSHPQPPTPPREGASPSAPAMVVVRARLPACLRPPARALPWPAPPAARGELRLRPRPGSCVAALGIPVPLAPAPPRACPVAWTPAGTDRSSAAIIIIIIMSWPPGMQAGRWAHEGASARHAAASRCRPWLRVLAPAAAAADRKRQQGRPAGRPASAHARPLPSHRAPAAAAAAASCFCCSVLLRPALGRALCGAPCGAPCGALRSAP